MNLHSKSTRLDAAGPAREQEHSENALPFSLEPPRAHLIANFRALCKDRALYYPVAYRLVNELGRGRQGIVFLGLRQGARGCITRHAIKLFDPAIYANARQYWTDMGRIAVQTSRLQTISSPHLVGREVYEETNGIGYVQMEAIDGISVTQLLDEKFLQKARAACTDDEWEHFNEVIFRRMNGRLAIQPGVALYIMRQVLRGLETLHDMEFVHSDVKPDNIMIDRLGYVKLVDYGRAVKIHERMTFLFGTPLFMAPEIHRREISMAQSDIYSTGLVGLEMLRGEPLVDISRMNEAQLLDYKLALPQRLSDLLPPHVKANKELTRMIRRFLEPDPKARYQRADDAESGRQGLRLVHRQLEEMGSGTEYGRELQNYVNRVLPAKKEMLLSDLGSTNGTF